MSLIASVALIPWSHLRAYERCPKPWDYLVAIALNLVVPFAAWVAPAKFGVTERLVGVALFAGGNALKIAAQRSNPFFVPAVRKPVFVVTRGPYAYLRHPGYTGMVASSAGVALMLGSAAAFIPVAVYLGLLMRRARTENELLKDVELASRRPI